MRTQYTSPSTPGSKRLFAGSFLRSSRPRCRCACLCLCFKSAGLTTKSRQKRLCSQVQARPARLSASMSRLDSTGAWPAGPFSFPLCVCPWSGSGSASPFRAQQARKVKLIRLNWLTRNRSTQRCDREIQRGRDRARPHVCTPAVLRRTPRPSEYRSDAACLGALPWFEVKPCIYPSSSSKVPPTFSAAGGRLHRCKQQGSVENAPLLSELCRGKARWEHLVFRLPRFWWDGCLRPLRPFFFLPSKMSSAGFRVEQELESCQLPKLFVGPSSPV